MHNFGLDCPHLFTAIEFCVAPVFDYGDKTYFGWSRIEFTTSVHMDLCVWERATTLFGFHNKSYLRMVILREWACANVKACTQTPRENLRWKTNTRSKRFVIIPACTEIVCLPIFLLITFNPPTSSATGRQSNWCLGARRPIHPSIQTERQTEEQSGSQSIRRSFRLSRWVSWVVFSDLRKDAPISTMSVLF